MGIWEQKSRSYLQKYPNICNSSFIGTQNRREQNQNCVYEQVCVALCTKCRCCLWSQYLWKQWTPYPGWGLQVTAELTDEGGRQRERMGSILGSCSQPGGLASALKKALWLQLATLTMSVCDEESTSCTECVCFEGKGVEGTERRRIVRNISCLLSELVSPECWSTQWSIERDSPVTCEGC